MAVTTSVPAQISTYGPGLDRVSNQELTIFQERGVLVEAALESGSDVAWVLFTVVSPSGAPSGAGTRQVVLRVDTTTGNQIGGPIDVPRGSSHIAIDRGVVWVPSTEDQSVTRIDAASGDRIGKPIEVGATNGMVAASGGVAWVGGEKDVIRITP